MTEQNSQPMDLLDQAIARLRDAPTPDGPPPHLVASTVEALQSSQIAPDVVRLRQRRRKMFRIARYSSAAAALLLAVSATGLLLMWPSRVPAFSDVVENVRKAKSVTFLTKMPSVIQGNRGGMLQQRFYMQGDVLRMELPSAQEGAAVPPDAPPVLLAIIMDAKQKKALQLDFTKKTAKFIKADDDKNWEKMAKAFANPVEQLGKLKGDDAERVGEEDLNGVKTEVYKLKKKDIFLGMRLGDGETAKLWVDAKTGLPVRIAIEPAPDKKDQAPLFVFEKFSWNDSLDAGLFKLEPPKGFKVEEE